ncbi:alkane 1-monooxygenase [Mycobacterium frederiksbergense]|uniref:Alkane 1-monooxygenase n=1 Tax=Mycolicibacterium frederiksbergense TaxID=117567 RepID=A0ABT6L5L5_9MYCO|nr:alkane 1-monooxygenase [Mycolicibacterium frederiksbergense]MDH6198219.1 alkane 1-monooxygenase [Mycolicibacterium frederiksbergense]
MDAHAAAGRPGNYTGSQRWRDPKRYAWLLGAVVPCLVPLSWLAVTITDLSICWWLGPLLTFIAVPVVDQLIGTDASTPPDDAYIELDRDRFYRWATWLYLPNQYLWLVFACWLWSGGGWVSMTWYDKLGLMATVGIVGGIGINAAHELGHKRDHLEKRLSRIALAQTGYGHFFVEHNRGHHVRVATPQDPASSRLGESVYRFVPRSVSGGVRSAWGLETSRLGRRGASPWTLKNDVLSGWLLTIALFAVLAIWFGPVVLPWLIGQAIVGFCLLEVVNYLEHYGLSRQLQSNGRYEKVSAQHSWNSNTLVANVFLFHLQRHSDHHANPQRRYQTLRSRDDAPQLPGGYGAMLVVALIPPLWRRVMDPLVAAHQARLALAQKGQPA